MKRYFAFFRLVELNSTFYRYPRLETVKSWREKAPESFEFTVKAHQDISHKAKMRLDEVCLAAFNRVKEICNVLSTKVLLFQTPASFRPDKLGDAENFFRSVKRDGLVLVWETRGFGWETFEAQKRLGDVLAGVGVSHVTDPFRVLPVYVGEVAYFRLHGLGERMYYYQYSDLELRRLFDLVKPYDERGKSVYVFFNNLAMFDDARRFAEFLERGRFPRLTVGVGVDSVKEVLAGTRFPVSKSALIKRFGWRLFEVKEGEQVRLGTFLSCLPQKSFKSLGDVLKEIKAKI